MSASPLPLGERSVNPSGSSRPVVLLVEDNDALRMLTRMMLEEGGFDVIDCATGRFALEVLTQRPGTVDLLMTDVNLTGMSGPELVTAAHAATPALPAIYVTGWDRARLFAWGVPAHALVLTKPFSEGDVVALAQHALWAAAE